MWCQQFDYFSKDKMMSHHILVFESQKERGQNYTVVKFGVKSTINSKYKLKLMELNDQHNLVKFKDHSFVKGSIISTPK